MDIIKEKSFKDVKDQLKLLIFDLDGTLVDSFKPMHETFNFTLKKFNLLEQQPRETEALIGIPLSKIFADMMDSQTDDPLVVKCIETYRERYKETCCSDSQLYESVFELIPRLSEKFKITLATTKKTDIAEIMLEYFDIKKYFSIILGVDRVSAAKPSPEIINKILYELDIKPQNAMMIGDSLFDLNAGKSAGVLTCSVTYGFEEKDILAANHPDFLIDGFGELGHLL